MPSGRQKQNPPLVRRLRRIQALCQKQVAWSSEPWSSDVESEPLPGSLQDLARRCWQNSTTCNSKAQSDEVPAFSKVAQSLHHPPTPCTGGSGGQMTDLLTSRNPLAASSLTSPFTTSPPWPRSRGHRHGDTAAHVRTYVHTRREAPTTHPGLTHRRVRHKTHVLRSEHRTPILRSICRAEHEIHRAVRLRLPPICENRRQMRDRVANLCLEGVELSKVMGALVTPDGMESLEIIELHFSVRNLWAGSVRNR